MDINTEDVANRIKTIRLKHGLTMEEFGKLFNTSKNSVSNWENARNLPNKSRLVEIAEYDSITLEELLYGNVKSDSSFLMDYLNTYIDSKREVIKQEVKLLTESGLEGLFRLVGLGKGRGAKAVKEYERHREQIDELEKFGKHYIENNYQNYSYSDYLRDFPNSDLQGFENYKEKEWVKFKEVLDSFWESFEITDKNYTWINNRFTDQITDELDEISKIAVEEGKEHYYVNEVVQPFLDQAAKDFKEYIKDYIDTED